MPPGFALRSAGGAFHPAEVQEMEAQRVRGLVGRREVHGLLSVVIHDVVPAVADHQLRRFHDFESSYVALMPAW